jgi:membrane complex biogenesis BtpA family protein
VPDERPETGVQPAALRVVRSGRVHELLERKPILGMIHLPALPGAPRHEETMDEIVQFALREAALLERAGVDGCIVENVGDVPLLPHRVPATTVAAMAVLVTAVRRATSLWVGVNILRNACEEALSVAHVCGADFIRCNVMIGAYVTDQGIVEGCAADLARLRRALGSQVLIFGDVHVKHAHPLYDVPIEHAAQDLAERGGADAVIVSGPRSPIPPSAERLASVKTAVELPVLVGSGIGLDNARELFDRSDGVIIGEPDFKIGGVWGGASDEAAYAEAVRRCRA